jgi:uncharacterized repeat protein (TIGR03803 family)
MDDPSACTQRAFCTCVVASLLAGCGGSQPSIGPVPGAMPERGVATTLESPAGYRYRVLHWFGGRSLPNEGLNPQAGLIDVGGTLYGTTQRGGASHVDCGTVFGIAPVRTEKILHRFRALGSGDGCAPETELISVNGTFYGTTYIGGKYGEGTVFTITPAGTERVLHSFGGASGWYFKGDGAFPHAGLTALNGTLYGTTLFGGKYHKGTIFSVTRTGTEKILHNFRGSGDGSNPIARLIDVNGILYGTTTTGGNPGGTVFSITPTGTLKVLCTVRSGSRQVGPLIEVDGRLYGTTAGGGLYNHGTVFSVAPTGAGTVQILHSFGGYGDGSTPYAGLTNVNGTLYGTTVYGGATPINGGTIFSITTAGSEKVVLRFNNATGGWNPYYGRLLSVNGTLYGTTYWGGLGFRKGIVFALKLR